MGSSMFSLMFMRFVYNILIYVHLLLTLLCFCSSQPLCREHEKSSLLQFKEGFIINKSASEDPHAYPKVDFWTREGGTSDCCFWDGIECDEDSGHVIGLDLSSSFLYGSLHSNSSLFNLVHLQRLNLADNNFNYSHIPYAIKHLSKLIFLNLSTSFFSGQIPLEISELSKLSCLDLSVNIDPLSGVKLLQLKSPNFEKLILNLTSLKQLHLSYVDISSTVPESLANFSSLTSLFLRKCGLKGEFPVAIFNLPYLQSLSVRFNKHLIGKLPPFKQSSPLKSLKLAGTRFFGDLPSSIDELLSLNELDVGGCNFSGVIPTSISKLKQLTYLDLSENNFTGPVPPSLANLSQLTVLFLQDCQLYGPIPESFTRLSNLESLNLQGNDLSGVVNFDMFFGLKNLIDINLSDNKLSVLSKSSINQSLPQYISLKLRSCNLKNFPDFLRYQERMEWLDVKSNQIGGQIPKWMLNKSIETLTFLDLSNNFLVGFEQSQVTLPWIHLRVLLLNDNMLKCSLPIPSISTVLYDISKNMLEGKISSSICNLRSLTVLDLSENKLGGRLPQCLGNFSISLSFLNLENNYFSGNIPQTLFADGNHLAMVDLSKNQFEGQLPKSLVKCRMLQYLSVESNQLSGLFPSWLGTLPELRILVLRRNLFHGVIREPQTQLEFPKLCIIDISYNSFTGLLPSRYIESWNAMKSSSNENFSYMMTNSSSSPNRSEAWDFYFPFSVRITTKGVDRYYERIQDVLAVVDLSNNKFDGVIPSVFGNLKGLHSLDLSNNNLVGDIPSSLGSLKELESLDLSQNKLSGEIPQEMTQLTFLQYLNVSHNRLTGPIPQENQISRFDSTSYEGNFGLCGIPLQNKCGNSDASRPPLPSILEKEQEDSESPFQFGWKVVVIGYGCGFAVGLFIGQMVIARRPMWLPITSGLRAFK